MTAKVFVVDDQPLNIKVLQAKLSSEYYEVLTATDGEQALDIVAKQNPDLLLLDVMMPGMDGFEVCRRIKHDAETWHLPVVMVTALSDRADKIRGLEAGADDFLTRPVNDVALFARIRSLLRLKMALDELRLREHTSMQLRVVDPDSVRAISERGIDARILVVEDCPIEARNIERVLSARNCVTCVGDEQAALELVDTDSFDLVIVSVDLQGTDRIRLGSRLRARNRTRRVPLLMLVDPNDAEKLAKGLEIGFNDYFFRPVDEYELIVRARRQVRHKRYLDQLRKSYRRSVAAAITDSLTGLHNRRYLTAHLDSLLQQMNGSAKSLVVSMVDVDHFKAINDTHGHTVGDEVLRELARRLTWNHRASDLSARFGDEEFVVVMPDTDLAKASVLAERIRAGVADRPFETSASGGEIRVTVSVGLAAAEPGDHSSDDVLKRADEALYAAKCSGRDQVITNTIDPKVRYEAEA